MPTKVEHAENILIVDDEEAIRAMMQRMVERIGCTPFVAGDGQAGLEEAAKVDPAVILLDLRMPRMDGHTFMRRFRNLSLDSAIIVTSADGEMDDVIEAMRHGAVDYVRKPFSNADIQAALARAMDIHDKRRTKARTLAAEGGVAEPAPAVPPPVFPALLEKIQQGEIVLPSPPSLVAELRRTIESKEATVESVARLVASDQALATRAIQLSRSAWFGAAKPTLDLATVISRIGFQKIQALAETVWLQGCFQVADSRFAALIKQQARFGLARAIAMRTFATALKLDPQLAYYTGLFADAGAAFLLYVVAEKTAAPMPSLEACLGFVRDHHEMIGGQLLAKWGHSEAIIRQAKLHHQHANVRETYAKLFVVATSVAHAITGLADITGESPSGDTVQRATAGLGFDARARDQLVDATSAELASVEQSLA